MKLNINYELLHSAEKAMSKGHKLNEKEYEAVRQLLVAAKDDYYPSEYEMQKQRNRLKELEILDKGCKWELQEFQIDFATQQRRNLYNKLLEECTVFENKWC